MCGRYGFVDPSKIKDRFEIENPQDLRDLKPRYNIAPSQWLPVITKNQVTNHNRVELMKWGLLPAWSSDPKKAAMMINARAETIHQKPSYQKPLRFQRCLIPVTHFFEWKQTKEGKIPYLIRLKNAEIFSFAGLYDVNTKVEEGKEIKTYTIITTEPNSLVEPIHNRMPVILKKTTENIWLDPNYDVEKLKGLLVPFSPSFMEAYPVSSLVNDPKNDFEEITKQINL